MDKKWWWNPAALPATLLALTDPSAGPAHSLCRTVAGESRQEGSRFQAQLHPAGSQLGQASATLMSSRQPGKNPRAAIEAIIRAVKHPFPAGKLPVRGLFRASCLVIASAAMTNLRSIWRFQQENNAEISGSLDFLAAFRQAVQGFSVKLSCFSC